MRKGAMPPCKRPRTFSLERTIPFDLVLEILARSDDAATVVRCAASCRHLRRDIVSPDFVRRVFHDPAGHVAPPSCVLGFLHAYDKSLGAPPPPARFSLAHPATPGAASFGEQLARFVSRGATRLLNLYDPLTSRNGLVVLYRRYIDRPRRPPICVYDPMTGDRTFLPGPPCIRQDSKHGVDHTYVLLTAADGIDSSFLLLAADFTGLEDRSCSIMVQIVSSDANGKWGPVTTMASHPRLRQFALQPGCSGVVLGGVIHWLMHWDIIDILTYDFRTATAGAIQLPTQDLPNYCTLSNLHLASSLDGKLSLFVGDRHKILVWQLLPDGAGWSQRAAIDATATVKTLVPEFPPKWWLGKAIQFASSGVRSGAILLRPFAKWLTDLTQEDGDGFVVLDMETKEMRRATCYGLPVRDRSGVAAVNHENILAWRCRQHVKIQRK